MVPRRQSTLLAASVAGLLFSGVRAQVGSSDVICVDSFGWANNSLSQNPCVVAAYLQADCNGGVFSVNSIPQGFHYIGPTNVTTTQNLCICSTPVYQLISACGACQGRTFISWESWHGYCPTSLTSSEGVFPMPIPPGTRVPNWAYLKPSDYGGSFDLNASQLVGDSPESSPSGASSTTASLATTNTASVTTTTRSGTVNSSPTSSPGGGNKNPSTSVGAIAGGVVGGVLGLALLGLLGLFIYRRKLSSNQRLAGPEIQTAGVNTNVAGGGGVAPVISGIGGVNAGVVAQPNMSQYTAVPSMSPPPGSVSQSHAWPVGPSTFTGSSSGVGGHSTGPGRPYDPNDPSTFPTAPALTQYPRTTGTHGSVYGSRGGTPGPDSHPPPGEPYSQPWGGYSGVPEAPSTKPATEPTPASDPATAEPANETPAATEETPAENQVGMG